MLQSIDNIVDAICGLSKANHLTGVWDGRRFDLCKKPVEQFSQDDFKHLYLTEKMSRSNVEKRAVFRQIIEDNFIVMVKPFQNKK